MSIGSALNECRTSLERVEECADQSVILLEAIVEKLSVLMATLKEARYGHAER